MHLVWMHSAWEGKTGRATAWRVYCKYVRICICTYVCSSSGTIGPILGHAHSSWHMHYTYYSLNVHLGRVSALYTVKLCICLYNMLWSVTVEQIVAWCGSRKCESIYIDIHYIDLNISCIYSGGEGEAKTIYMSVVYMYKNTWEYESLHVSMSHIWWEVVGVVSHTWWDCGEWQGT